MLNKINEEKHATGNSVSGFLTIVALLSATIYSTIKAINESGYLTVEIVGYDWFFWSFITSVSIAFIIWVINTQGITDDKPHKDLFDRYADQISCCFDNDRNVIDGGQLLFIIFNMKSVYKDDKINELLNKFIDHRSSIGYSTKKYCESNNVEGREFVLYFNSKEIAKIRIS